MSAILQPGRSGRLFADLATTPEAVLESQRLRYRIFAQELGARLSSAADGIDQDRFDPHCHHLLVRDVETGQIVASTRLLTDEGAERAGGFYSESEFDMAGILTLQGRKLEVGRTCVDPAFRQGAAIAVLWSGLAGFIQLHHIDYLFGCASIDLDDQGVRAAVIMRRLRQHAFAEPSHRVTPRLPLSPASMVDDSITAPLPPLLKAYVRLGARACGEACRDPDFNVADVFMLLDIDELDPSYSRHFMSRATL